jgi:hypothetical protein
MGQQRSWTPARASSAIHLASQLGTSSHVPIVGIFGAQQLSGGQPRCHMFDTTSARDLSAEPNGVAIGFVGWSRSFDIVESAGGNSHE